MPFAFDNQFATDFFWAGERVPPTPLTLHPKIFTVNDVLARELQLDDISHQDWLKCCAKGELAPGMEPFAQVYAGHQFGHFVPQLGDGRALLLGQQRDNKGQLWDLQLKGAGKTPYSRFGDGRAVLRSSIREYLASEALHYLDIPTTRALVLTHSQEPVYREDIEYAATLLRAAPSHLRFGHLEYFSHRGDIKAVTDLVDHTIAVHYPDVAQGDFTQWFRQVMERTAKLIAKWQAFGFCHGVLNTDNMSLLGLTLDYGPYGFLERYDPHHICNASDTLGRYAFDQQPAVGFWNLQRLAQAVGFLISVEKVEDILQDYQHCLLQEYSRLICTKLGIVELQDTDPALVRDMFTLMAKHRVDFTHFFRALCTVEKQGECPDTLRAVLGSDPDWMQWVSQYQVRLQHEESCDAERQESMHLANPAFVLRNWVAQTVVEAGEKGDTEPLETVMDLIRDPFNPAIEGTPFTQTAPDQLQSLKVSCSS